MISKLDYQTFTSEFESHWIPHPYGFVPPLSKKFSKFQQFFFTNSTYPFDIQVLLLVNEVHKKFISKYFTYSRRKDVLLSNIFIIKKPLDRFIACDVFFPSCWTFWWGFAAFQDFLLFSSRFRKSVFLVDVDLWQSLSFCVAYNHFKPDSDW